MKISRRSLLGAALGSLCSRKAWSQLVPWGRRAIAPTGGAFSPLAVLLDGQQSMWDFPAMTDASSGVLSFWAYVPNAPGQYQANPPAISDFYKLTGSFAYILTAPSEGALFIGQSYGGDTSINISAISSATQAVVTLIDGLTTQLPAIGSALQIYVQPSTGWTSGPAIYNIVATTATTVTLNWDTSALPAYAGSGSHVTFCYATAFTLGNPSIVTFNTPHGIDTTASNVWVALSGFEQDAGWFALNDKVVALVGGSTTTLEIDLDTTGLSAWVPALNFVRPYVVNSADVFLASDAAQDKFFVARTTKPLPIGSFVNVKMSWDTNQAAGSKKFSMTFNGVSVVPYWTRDADTAFSVGYSQASTDVNTGWKVSGSGSTSDTSAYGYLAEYYFNAGAPYMDMTDPTVDAKFRDAATGNPVDLGSNGSGPTGSAPTLYLSLRTGSVTPPPALTWWEPDGADLLQSPGVLGGIANSTSMVCSFWLDRNTNGGQYGIMVGPGCSITWDNETSPFTVSVNLNSAGSAGNFDFTFPYDGGSGVNIRMSVDTNHPIGSKIVKAYVGTSAATVTVVTDDTNNLAVNWQDGATDFNAISGTGGYLAELWFGPGQLFDVSSKFVDGSGNPVDLGAHGELPSGTSPAVFLHLGSGDPVTNLNTNLGTGGNFTGAASFLLQSGSRFTDNLSGAGSLRLATAPLLIAPISP